MKFKALLPALLGVAATFCAAHAYAQDVTIVSEFSPNVKLVITKKNDKKSYNAYKDLLKDKIAATIIAKIPAPKSKFKYIYRTGAVVNNELLWLGDLQSPEFKDDKEAIGGIPDLAAGIRYCMQRKLCRGEMALPSADGSKITVLKKSPVMTPYFDDLASLMLYYRTVLSADGKRISLLNQNGKESAALIMETKLLIIPPEELMPEYRQKGIKAVLVQYQAHGKRVGVGLARANNVTEWFPVDKAYQKLFDAQGYPIVGKGLNQKLYNNYLQIRFAADYMTWMAYMSMMNSIIANLAVSS